MGMTWRLVPWPTYFDLYYQLVGTYKVRNETKSTKPYEINEMETKWNETNEIDWYEENGRKKIKDKTK